MDSDGRRRWLILAAMTGTLSMILLDSTVVSVALPSIQRDLDMSQTELQWVVNAYLLSLASLVAVTGRISDMVNRVGLLIAGIVLFVCASAACGLAGSDTALLTSRTIQGIGAAMMVPPTATIVTNTFPLAERGRAMGIYAGISMIFLSLGPLVGGFFTEYVDWRWVFWINLPLGVATIAMILRTRPEGHVEGGQHFDFPGFATLVPGLAALVLGLMQSNTWGWGSARVLALLIGGVALLAVFVVVEHRAHSPLVQLRLFRTRNFRGDSLVLFCIQFSLTGITVFGAIFVQDLLGYSAMEAGLTLLPLTLPLLVCAPLGGRIFDRIGPRALVSSGALLVGIGLLWTAAVVPELEYAWLVPGYVLLGVGIGLVMSPSNTDAMSSAPRVLRGQASGAIQTVRQVGGTVGLAIVGAIVAGVQSNRIQDLLLGLGEPEAKVEQLQRVLAEDTETKQQITQGIPSSEVAQVTAGAKDALADGIAAGYWVCGGLMVLTALAAFAILRRVEYPDEGVAPATAPG